MNNDNDMNNGTNRGVGILLAIAVSLLLWVGIYFIAVRLAEAQI